MRKKEIENIRKQLIERKNELLDELLEEYKIYAEHMKPETGDLADESYREIEKELSHSLSAKEKEELDDINIALKKIEEGTYGICEECGAEIPVERLKIAPFARYCVKCKEKIERSQRRKPIKLSFPEQESFNEEIFESEENEDEKMEE